MDYQTQAIILKIYRLNEADKILHLYSPSHGPIRVVAKSAFKTNSKLVSKTQVLNVCDFLLASGRNLDIIKEAKLIKQYNHINCHYDALIFASFFADILNHIAVNDDHYDEPFLIITKLLGELNDICQGAMQKQDLIFSSCKYLWLMIDMLGYKPDLNTCSITHQERPLNHTPQYFDFAGGAITSNHGYLQELQDNPYQDNIRTLNPGIFKILEDFDKSKFKNEMQIHELQETFKLLHRHLAFRLHKELKSWKLVEQILGDAKSPPNDVFLTQAPKTGYLKAFEHIS